MAFLIIIIISIIIIAIIVVIIIIIIIIRVTCHYKFHHLLKVIVFTLWIAAWSKYL